MKDVKAGLMRALSSDLQPYLNLYPVELIYDHDLGPGARTAVAANMLLQSATKKFSAGDSTTSEQDALALEKFLEANAACRDYALANPLVDGVPILEEVRLELFRLFGNIDLKGWFSYITTGPKASSGAKRYDLMCKLWDSSLSATDPRLHEMYLRGLTDPRWVSAEQQRRAKWGSKVVEGATLCFVLKQDDVSRIICVEPVLNGALQQALRARMESAIQRHYGIDLRNQQEINRGLARQGSIHGNYATIDLISASDYISIALCRYMLPPGLFQALWVTRSPKVSVKLAAGARATWVETHMMGTMGNATTFPLQTAIFAAVTKAVARAKGVLWKPQVNGDDIIVPTSMYDDVVNALTTLGFRVNLKKSFACGSFRESCGGDYYLGFNVRGVYIKRLSNKTDFLSAFNRLRAWSREWGVSLFRTLLFLRRRMGSVPYVHYDVDVGGGIHTDFTRARRYGRVKYDPVVGQYLYVQLAKIAKPIGKKAPCADAAILAALSRRHHSYPPPILNGHIDLQDVVSLLARELRTNLVEESQDPIDEVSVAEKEVKVVIQKITSKSYDWRVFSG